MIAKFLSVFTGCLAVLCISAPAKAVDQLPLPNPNIVTASAEINEFSARTTPASSANVCADRLVKNSNNDERIKAIKAYRQCRANHALAQLAVWRWQDDSN